MVFAYGVAPGRSVTSVSSSNSRAAPVCTGPVSKATLNCLTPTVNGCSWSSENQAPVVRSSYWVTLLAKPCPTITTLVPRKPYRPPTATPTSRVSRLRWKTRLPASRR